MIVLAQPAAATVITVAVGYYVLAIGVVIVGLMDVASGLSGRREWLAVIVGVLQIALGVLVMFYPAVGAQVMLQLLGASVIALGVVALATAVARA